MPNGRWRTIRWSKILAATDFSPQARVALRSAEALARETGAGLVFFHAVDVPPTSYLFGVETPGLPDVRERWVGEATKLLRATRRRLEARGTRAIQVEVRLGRPWSQIVEAAREHQADLVVLGNSGRSRFERLLLGSTAENVVRHSPVPVLVTRSRPLERVGRVLVPVSFDEGSRQALAFAMERLPRAAAIEAFHAVAPIPVGEAWLPVEPPSAAEVTRELRAYLDSLGARRARASVAIGVEVASAILARARAWRADLILLSTHGRGGLAHVLLGSVAEKVARYADRPVLVLPPPGRTRGAVRPAAGGAGAKRAVPRRGPEARRPRAVPPRHRPEPRPRPPARKRPGPWTGQAHTGRGPE